MKNRFILLAALLTACTKNEPTIAVTEVSLNKSAIMLNIDQDETLIAHILPTDATNKTVSWSSSNPLVAIVNNEGKISTINYGTSTVTVTTECGNLTASCEVTVYPPGGLADILYFAPDGTLSIGRWGNQVNVTNMAFFQFGGLIGFTAIEGQEWYQTTPLFNPTGIDYREMYNFMPVYDANDWENGIRNISASNYHHLANIKLGKGDPCKLVDKKGAEIQAMTQAAFDTFNSGWRLPTIAENQLFSGRPGEEYLYTAHWTTYNGTNGGMFPNSAANSSHFFLPAAGYRWFSGGAMHQKGVSGDYWSNEAATYNSGHTLSFDSQNVYTQNNYYTGYGFAVRCVRE